jgi:malonyl-CoA decarboxylase
MTGCGASPFISQSPPPAAGDAERARRALNCFEALLSPYGDVSGARLAGEALAVYRSLSGPSLEVFHDRLASQFSVGMEDVRRVSHAYCQDPSFANLARLQQALESPRQELFRRLNLTPGGTSALIELRRRILTGMREHPSWASIDADLGALLKSWFNGGFLELRRLDWHTPSAVLENLIRYEAVHRVRGWRELRRRLEADRRCFGLFHPAVPDEPLIFTELALTSGVSGKVQPLLDPGSVVIDPESCNCAVFYSISNCHDGLRGIPFGNLLIRRVVDALRGELPQLKTFATLSPVPGFRAWLTSAGRDGDRRRGEIVEKLNDPAWIHGPMPLEVQRTLLSLCASYLLHGKRGAEPADAVARFHLSNGARLERLNWLGDTSAAGLQRSAGVTANYIYSLPEIDRNHQAYVTDHTVIASQRVHRLARSRHD